MSAIFQKNASRPYPLKGVERRTFLMTLFVIVAGVAISILLKSWDHLERSGSIVVIIGIHLAWKDMTGKLNWATKYVKYEISNLATDTADEELILFEKDVVISLEILKKRIRNLEAAILAVGTFIWGYGSLLGNAVYKFV